ncbi:MAG: ATP-binding protein [Campylobacter sp.]|nr:ATP-binding protein [Campylobacter sp.]
MVSLNEKFEFLKERINLTQKDLCKVLGKGESTISAILKGGYKSAKTELYEAKLNAFMDSNIKELMGNEETRSQSDNGAKEPWLSKSQKAIKNRVLAMMSSPYSFFELVLGESGMGKTHLLKGVCKEFGGVYVKARRSLSSSAFMSQILKALGENPRGNTDDKLNAICEECERQNIKLIVIDEADLFERDNDFTFERKFELLREIFEFSKDRNLGISVIAVGLTKLKKRIDKLGGYLQSRLTYSPVMNLSHDELMKIGEIMGLSAEVSEYLSDGVNARLFEKTAANTALGFDERVAANLVYQVRR